VAGAVVGSAARIDDDDALGRLADAGADIDALDEEGHVGLAGDAGLFRKGLGSGDDSRDGELCGCPGGVAAVEDGELPDGEAGVAERRGGAGGHGHVQG